MIENLLDPTRLLPGGWRDPDSPIKKGEVYFLDGAGELIAPEKECRKVDAFVIQCSRCSDPAYELDSLFPYHWEQNRCRNCIRQENKVVSKRKKAERAMRRKFKPLQLVQTP